MQKQILGCIDIIDGDIVSGLIHADGSPVEPVLLTDGDAARLVGIERTDVA